MPFESLKEWFTPKENNLSSFTHHNLITDININDSAILHFDYMTLLTTRKTVSNYMKYTVHGDL